MPLGTAKAVVCLDKIYLRKDNPTTNAMNWLKYFHIAVKKCTKEASCWLGEGPLALVAPKQPLGREWILGIKSFEVLRQLVLPQATIPNTVWRFMKFIVGALQTWPADSYGRIWLLYCHKLGILKQIIVDMSLFGRWMGIVQSSKKPWRPISGYQKSFWCKYKKDLGLHGWTI